MIRGGPLREGPNQKVRESRPSQQQGSHAPVVVSNEDRHIYVLHAVFIWNEPHLCVAGNTGLSRVKQPENTLAKPMKSWGHIVGLQQC